MLRRTSSTRIAATLPDLVVLALLSERPMHGYQIWRELVRREVQDWAAVSRAQVYYSLGKILENGWAKPARNRTSSGGSRPAERRSTGPERQVVALTAKGRAASRRALDRDLWATSRPPPPFLTWLCLSHLASRDSLARGIRRRREFLAQEIEKETRTLSEIRVDSGPMIPVAELVVDLAIRQFELERAWLSEVESRLLGKAAHVSREKRFRS